MATTYDNIINGVQPSNKAKTHPVVSDPYEGSNSAILGASQQKQGGSTLSTYGNGVDKGYDNTYSPIVGAGAAKQGTITAGDALKKENQYANPGNSPEASAERKKKEEEESPSTASTEPKTVQSFHDFVQAMEAARQLTPEQEMEMAKRRKRQSVASAIGDGLSALANLYFTKQYAPNVQGQGKLSEKNQARWDKWDAEIKANKKSYADAMRKAEQAERELQLKKTNADRDFDLKERKQAAYEARQNALAEQDSAKKKYWQAKADALERGASLDEALKEANIALKQAQTKTEEGKPAVQQSQIEKNKKQGDAALMNASANQTRAAKSGSSSSKTTAKEREEAHNQQVWDEFDAIYRTPEGRKAAKAYATNNNLNVNDNTGTSGYLGDPSKGRSGNWSDTKNREGFVNWYKRAYKPTAKQQKTQQKNTQSKGRTGNGSAKSKFSIHKK